MQLIPESGPLTEYDRVRIVNLVKASCDSASCLEQAVVELMSAFPESGRSDRQKLGEIKVRFRPQAAYQFVTLRWDSGLPVHERLSIKGEEVNAQTCTQPSIIRSKSRQDTGRALCEILNRLH